MNLRALYVSKLTKWQNVLLSARVVSWVIQLRDIKKERKKGVVVVVGWLVC
jgi:hypothetical protein